MFIKDLSKKVKILYDIMNNKTNYDQTIVDKKSSEIIKELLESKGLTTPNFEKKFIIETDASEKALGFILLQEEDKIDKIIKFGSRMLSNE
ncbi:hypothetical protein HERIO_1826 [Hepatospora eriocheir]|uniref:Reverse transcriptase/retrotransposon-derived protein RNase H-like domain-containing protein n=1 Tax=Hepatospora eriocheir TaxID=1081669 RepID=A0A1X0Q952_9MICR|nr:hypothetical protein HERIO_1826 [Hepatospora eriocheir]